MPSPEDWLRSFVERYGPPPDDYLVVDTETTGLDTGDDLIVQLGYCRVQGGQVLYNEAHVLDWTSHPSLDQDWLRARLESTAAQMRARGSSYPWTVEVMAGGVAPTAALSELFRRLNDTCLYGGSIVAHNGYGFDLPMIESHFRRFLFLNWRLCDRLWDTGLMEKAMQLDLRPRDGESLGEFCRRVRFTRAPGVRWSLERHVVPKYGLAEKHGYDLSRHHTADFDALVTGHFLEEFRALLGAAPAAS